MLLFSVNNSCYFKYMCVNKCAVLLEWKLNRINWNQSECNIWIITLPHSFNQLSCLKKELISVQNWPFLSHRLFLSLSWEYEDLAASRRWQSRLRSTSLQLNYSGWSPPPAVGGWGPAACFGTAVGMVWLPRLSTSYPPIIRDNFTLI